MCLFIESIIHDTFCNSPEVSGIFSKLVSINALTVQHHWRQLSQTN